jgi:hypothetical protein
MRRFYFPLFFGVSSISLAAVDHVLVTRRLDAKASSTLKAALKNRKGQSGQRIKQVDDQNSLFSQLMFDAIFSDNVIQLSDVIFTMIGQLGVERSLRIMHTILAHITYEPSLHNHAYESLVNHIAMFSFQHNERQQAAVNNVKKNKPVVRAASVAAHAVARVMQKKSVKSMPIRTAGSRASIRKKKTTKKRQHNSKRHVIRRNSSKSVRRKPLSKSKPIKHVIPQQQPKIVLQSKPVPQQKPSYVPAVPSIQITKNQAQQQRMQLPLLPRQHTVPALVSVARSSVHDRSLQEVNRSAASGTVVQKQEKLPVIQEKEALALPQIHVPLDKDVVSVSRPALSVCRLPEVPASTATAKLVIAEQEVRPAMQQKGVPVLPQKHAPLLRKRIAVAKPVLSENHVPAPIAETAKSVELKQEKRPVIQQRGAPALPARDALLESTCAQADEVAVEQSVQDQQSPQIAESSVVAPVEGSPSRVERMLSCARSVFSDDESDEESDSEWDAVPLDANTYDRAEILMQRAPAQIAEISVEQQQQNRAQEAVQTELLREQLLARNRVMHASDYDSDEDAFSD